MTDWDSEERLTFLNYGYAYDTDTEEQTVGHLASELYSHVASKIDLREKRVLEVGSGHGAGAAYVFDIFSPRSVTGVDINPKAVKIAIEKLERKLKEFNDKIKNPNCIISF